MSTAALPGLAFLLFLAGLEVDLRAMTLRQLRAPRPRRPPAEARSVTASAVLW
jgi:Kef-type K+ transport system membrane component KefB